MQGRHKSGTFRKVKVKAATGVRTHFRLRKPSAPRCGITHQVLPGVARERPTKMQNMAKTQKRPERPYGGVLSSRAARMVIKARAREQDNTQEE